MPRKERTMVVYGWTLDGRPFGHYSDEPETKNRILNEGDN